MKKIISWGLVFSLAIFTLSLTPALGYLLAFAEGSAQDAGSTADISEPINAGNEICPVSGDKIKEEDKAAYEYEGKIYNFCCPSCIAEFKKDPQKYIKKVEEEKHTEPASKPADSGAMQHSGHSHQ